MTDITTEQIKELRDRTGVSVMQCKRALEEAEGDIEKAVIILRKHSSAIAQKKSDRELCSGVVQAYIHNTKDVGALVQLSCETDFVAKNEEFIQLAYDIAMHITAANPIGLSREDITESDMKTARDVFKKEIEGKPQNMHEKILEGKLDAYFKDKILLEQPFIKSPEVTIQDLISSAVQKFGERVELTAFTRYSIR